MTFITKPNFVQPKTKILAEDINKIIQGLIDTENYLENLVRIVEDHIEYGRIVNIPTGDTGLLTYNITFSKPFTSPPRIFLGLENMHIDVNIKPLYVTNISNTGFTLNVYVVKKKAGTSINVTWLAIL